ncbi:MAG: hypothetical protein Q9182_004198 [Xanthomendoza sp. 2 TL-2023]
MDSDYHLDESIGMASKQSGSVAVASVHPSLNFPPDYPGYSTVLREARQHYGENNPPFTIKDPRFHAPRERETTLAGPGGLLTARITPDLLTTVTTRIWNSQMTFWTMEYKGQRFIVKYMGGVGYKRWLGLERGFEDRRFLLPKASLAWPTSETRLRSHPFPGLQAIGSARKELILDFSPSRNFTKGYSKSENTTEIDLNHYGHEHYEQGLEVTPLAYPMPDFTDNESDDGESQDSDEEEI